MDKVDDLALASAVQDFRAARRKAALQDIVARLTGKPGDLLSYDEVVHLLKTETTARRGLQEIPLDAIVGSVGRYTDFTRTFLPRRDVDQERWTQIRLRALYQGGLPPIEVYKIGDAYFVLDGNRRVSVARQLGAETIQAYVTEIHPKIPIGPDTQLDDLIVGARYADFLERTELGSTRPAASLLVTAPGQYRVLEDEIELHRRRLTEELGRDVALSEAAADWYDHEYLPVARVIRQRGILQDFPGRTETDLYVWVNQHRSDLEEELGWQVDTAAAVTDFSARFGESRRRIVTRLSTRLRQAVTSEDLQPGPAPGEWSEGAAALHDHDLFAHVLVPLDGRPTGWPALEQALLVAQREGGKLYGLHVVASDDQRTADTVKALRARFKRRTETAGVPAVFSVDTGRVSRAICRRAKWTDLVVVRLTFPPGATVAARLGSGFWRLIQRCSRPILAVPGRPSLLRHALLAYDGSAKADEALFVATYLAVKWRTHLTVLTVIEPNRTTPETLVDAQDYLMDHGVTADYVETGGSVADAILTTAQNKACDCLIMGGYGYRPVLEVVLGSTVDRILRSSRLPVWICR